MALMQERSMRPCAASCIPGSIAAASRQIAAGSMDLHDRTESRRLRWQTAASVEQITATAKQSADHVRG